MYTLKNPLFRPSSRPSSPAPPSRPDSGIAFERSRPLHKLSLSTFRRPSPAPPSPTTQPLPLIQDGSYLEMLSLKLSEAVSKALSQSGGTPSTQDSVAGRRPIPAGRGQAFGALIASELKSAGDNPHLYRAILRSLHRPLSVLLSNLSSHLLPLLSSPAFSSAALTQPSPNATQIHALAIAGFCGELLDIFDECGLGHDSDVRGDGLKVIREGLTSIVNRVINPLVAGIKNELTPLLDALEFRSLGRAVPGSKAPVVHPAIVTLQSTIPVHARLLARAMTSSAAQSTLAAFLISVVWRGLVALSHRPCTSTPPSSPGLSPTTLVKRSSESLTPPLTPPSSRFAIKLPSPSSRPPSPPIPTHSGVSSDAHSLYDLLSLLPRPNMGKESTLAREAVEVAFEGLKSLPGVFEAFQSIILKIKCGADINILTDELELQTAEVPTLIALPIALHLCTGSPLVSAVLGLSEEEYRTGCLTGFGRADECATVVGERILGALKEEDEASTVVKRWLSRELEDAASST